jgi:rhamnulokinase
MTAVADFIAVDLGASSGRVFVAGWDGGRLSLSPLHRFANGGVRVHGSLYWDVLWLWEQIQLGLRHYAGRRGTLRSIGIDSWGVDYALIGPHGRMLENPHHYRDTRTEGVPERLYEVIPRTGLFMKTGIQPLAINSLFQLYSMVLAKDPLLEHASCLLTMPDLFHYFLTGEICTEPTIASTTQMLSVGADEWCHAMLSQLQIPAAILPTVVPTGTRLARVNEQTCREAGIAGAFHAVATASHDTASAIAAIPDLSSQSVFISSGTWSLIGVERDEPILTEEAQQLGFSNERSASGGYLFLKNVTGLWLLQECRRRWSECGRHYDWDDLVTAAAHAESFRCWIDPNAPEFAAPHDMPQAIQQHCARTQQWVPQTDAEIVRCCIEGLASEYRSVVASLQRLAGARPSEIRMVGGGTQNQLLCQMTADACGLAVIAGPAEASAIGNAVVQAVAAGEISDLESARVVVADSFERATYLPRSGAGWDDAEASRTRIRLQPST